MRVNLNIIIWNSMCHFQSLQHHSWMRLRIIVNHLQYLNFTTDPRQ